MSEGKQKQRRSFCKHHRACRTSTELSLITINSLLYGLPDVKIVLPFKAFTCHMMGNRMCYYWTLLFLKKIKIIISKSQFLFRISILHEEAFPSMHLQHSCVSPRSIKINKLEPSGPKTRGLVSICFSPLVVDLVSLGFYEGKVTLCTAFGCCSFHFCRGTGCVKHGESHLTAEQTAKPGRKTEGPNR